MKVLCINNDYNSYLNIGKWYEIIGEGNFGYKIINDHGDKRWYRKSRFKTQAEVREEKLNELGL